MAQFKPIDTIKTFKGKVFAQRHVFRQQKGDPLHG